jgi:predicted phosphodiesterase
MILIVGDVHGNFKALDKVIFRAQKKAKIDAIVQVGDFGILWGNESPYRFDYQSEVPFLFVDGNHENFSRLEKNKFPLRGQPVEHMTRGETRIVDSNNSLFIGGAASIDKDWRTPGMDWFPEEEITSRQIQRIVEEVLPTSGKIDCVFSHEKPESFPLRLATWKDDHPPSSGQRALLQILFQEVNPKFWFFGHYHEPDQGVVGNCNWYCVPIIESMQAILFDGKEAKWINTISFNNSN